MKSRLNSAEVNPLLAKIEESYAGYKVVCKEILDYMIRHDIKPIKISRVIKDLADGSFDEETLVQGVGYLNSMGLLSNHAGKSGNRQVGEEIYSLRPKFVTQEKRMKEK